MLVEMSKEFPEYGFEKHKGYGTKLHREILLEKGPCRYHRKSFLSKILGNMKNNDKKTKEKNRGLKIFNEK